MALALCIWNLPNKVNSFTTSFTVLELVSLFRNKTVISFVEINLYVNMNTIKETYFQNSFEKMQEQNKGKW